MTPLSNIEIEEILSKYNNFRGVFSKDQLPNKINDNEIGVINLDNSGGGGTHWVCYYNSSSLPENKYVIYFDSYGLPNPEEIKKYLKTSNKLIKYNTSEIQKMNSIMCGYYCIHLLDELMKGVNFYDAIYSFSTLPNDNNEKLIRNIADHII